MAQIFPFLHFLFVDIDPLIFFMLVEVFFRNLLVSESRWKLYIVFWFIKWRGWRLWFGIVSFLRDSLFLGMVLWRLRFRRRIIIYHSSFLGINLSNKRLRFYLLVFLRIYLCSCYWCFLLWQFWQLLLRFRRRYWTWWNWRIKMSFLSCECREWRWFCYNFFGSLLFLYLWLRLSYLLLIRRRLLISRFYWVFYLLFGFGFRLWAGGGRLWRTWRWTRRFTILTYLFFLFPSYFLNFLGILRLFINNCFLWFVLHIFIFWFFNTR